MLKAAIKVYKNIDIGKYSKLTAYLKSESRGCKAKKAAVLERAHVEEFFFININVNVRIVKFF
jgi:hypothetical protein